MSLTTEIIEDANPGLDMKGNLTDKPYKLYDSSGLFLLVTPTGGKWWRFKYRYGGKENQLSLGTYPLVPLTEARIKRDAFRALLKNGIDPSAHVREEREARRAE
ncbi:MAG: Arm DNA-binding domain-containing protein, partial [Nitrospinota bacterium]|nr:Arm DNA-binding domain-containing protein [Nitrospinota bacterium]